MKKTKIIYWIFTGLFAALMLSTAIPSIIPSADSIKFMTGHLGYPEYFIPFVGIAKILGAIAILIPGFPRIKEWAYAGLFFDLIAAIYSLSAVGDPFSQWAFILLPILLGTVSYIYYHKKLKGQ